VQVDPHRRLRAPEHRRDLRGRQLLLHLEDHRRPLLRREAVHRGPERAQVPLPAEGVHRIGRGRRLAIDRSRPIVARLSVVFGLDSFAGSLTVQSFLAYFFATRFAADPAVLGGLFFSASILSAASFPVAAWLSRRIGLVNTMVFTHIPSSLFLIGVAVAPSFFLAAPLFLARAALASMDVPTRQSYTMAVVDPAERTATAGVTSLARGIAAVPAPVIAGSLLVPLGLGVPLIATGVLKIGYDLALFALFRARPAPEEKVRIRPS